MAGLTGLRPVFTIAVGSNGVGKRAWKRSSYDLLPDRYYDQDAVAGGIGDWNSEEARAARGCWWMPTSTSPPSSGWTSAWKAPTAGYLGGGWRSA